MSTEPLDLGIEDLTDAVEVGAGGFGTVYKAHQESLRRDVAVKMVTSTVKDRKVRIRFEREIQAMGMLSGHPNIVTVYDSGFTGSGQPYILMDYMEQGSLADRLKSESILTWQTTADIMVKVCGALETAHQAGILHRDIKPENILVSAYGEPKLGDFGIARLKGGPETGTSSLTASIEHVSPELLEAKAPSVASDVYALGSTMYKMLTGEAAFIRPSDESIVPALTRIRDEPVPNLRQRGVPDPVARIVEQAMAKDPAARFPSSAEMGRALRSAQGQMGLAATPLPIREEEAAAVRDATKTINSDDLAKSIDDIRQTHPSGPVGPSGPVPGPGGPGTYSGPVGTSGSVPPQGYGQRPQVGVGATGGYGPPGPTGPQYGQRPAQGFQGAPPQQFQRPAAPAKKTPWALIVVGVIAGIVVVAGIGVALSGGGDDPGPVVTVPPISTTPPVAPTTEPEPQAYEFTSLVDSTGQITVAAPQPWSDTDLGPWVVDGNEIGWQIVASPDLQSFRASWNQPGLIFGVSESLASSFGPAELLDQFSFAGQCDYQGRTDYTDGLYTGFRDDYADCGGTSSSYTVVAAWPAANDALLLLQFQSVDEALDGPALERALNTFLIVPPEDAATSPTPAPTDTGS